ncbi:MAG TPA: potassium-transporting ATPase subunit F [Acidimicrobiales bacterium]|nr:potassium-transporting ATPase subunit F [Acidimicrobiales bacterium]
MLATVNGDDIIAIIMAVLIAAYLVYALVRPEAM